MNIFVKKNDTVDVVVYVWSKDDNIDATATDSEVPKDVEAQKSVFTFRRPSYQDSTNILRASVSSGGIDAPVFQDSVLRSQLVGWDLKDEEGKPVPVNVPNVNDLQPAVARAAVAGFLSKVKI